MATKHLYDKRAQDRQTHRSGAIQHLYRQAISTLMLVKRDFARIVSRGLTAITTRLKLLALPAGAVDKLSMLAKGAAAAVYRGQVRLS